MQVIEPKKNETENKELKTLLENVVPALKIHLEHAIMVQNKLPK